MPNPYGVPEDNTDGTGRAGVLAPAINATGYGLGDLHLRGVDAETRLSDVESLSETTAGKVENLEEQDFATQSQLDSARSSLEAKDNSHDSALGSLQQRMQSLEAAQISTGVDVAPGSAPVPPFPTGGGYTNPVVGYNPQTGAPEWQEAKGGGGGGTTGTVTSYSTTTRNAVVAYTVGPRV